MQYQSVVILFQDNGKKSEWHENGYHSKWFLLSLLPSAVGSQSLLSRFNPLPLYLHPLAHTHAEHTQNCLDTETILYQGNNILQKRTFFKFYII